MKDISSRFHFKFKPSLCYGSINHIHLCSKKQSITKSQSKKDFHPVYKFSSSVTEWIDK